MERLPVIKNNVQKGLRAYQVGTIAAHAVLINEITNITKHQLNPM